MPTLAITLKTAQGRAPATIEVFSPTDRAVLAQLRRNVDEA
jgi:hypothetical protein